MTSDSVHPPLHKLLTKQLQKAKSSDGSVDLDALVTLVSGAYDESDRDRRRTDRSISMMVEELDRLNSGLEDLVATRTSELEHVGARLEGTLDNVDQGIMMIDADGRIVVHNARLVDLLDIPAEYFESHPQFSDMVAMQEANGEFDGMDSGFKTWIRETRGQFAGAFSFQRKRPSGRVLEINITPMPTGGEVRTISDVTELVSRAQEIDTMRMALVSTIEHVEQGIMMIDPDGIISVANQRAAELLGVPVEFFLSRPSLDHLVDFQISTTEFPSITGVEADIQIARSMAKAPQVYERRRPNGMTLEVRTTPLQNGGEVRTFTDISARLARESALRSAEAEYRGLFENAVIGVYRTSIDGRLMRANLALARMHGYETEEEMLDSVNDLAQTLYVDPRRRDDFLAAMAVDGRTTDFVSEVYRLKTRKKFWASESAWVVRDEFGAPLCFEGMVVDATSRKTAEAEIAHIALHDMLTGLPNRTLFHDRLSTALSEHRGGHELAVICIDLDHFKEVNDMLGHDHGDILLRLASRRIQRAISRTAMAARLGGDEFAIVETLVEDRETIVQLARSLVKNLSRAFRIRGNRIFVGASVGIAVSPSDGVDPQDLLKKADIALYRAKSDGRGTFAFFDEGMTATLQARRAIEADLRRAITQDEFVVYYQPIISLETGKPSSYEALVRWQHPEKGLLPPGAFIDVAEESGLINAIGEIVLRRACYDIAMLDSTTRVSINLSPVQFRNHQLAVSVVNALASSGLAPHRLDLEITESILMTDDKRTLDFLRQIRHLGVRIALDDFGIGHSSLSYLQKFRFDKIKVDRSFVQAVDGAEINTAILRAVLGLGRDLDIEVVVEGVETEEQLALVTYEGCLLVQGYYFGRPARLSSFSRYFETLEAPLRAIA